VVRRDQRRAARRLNRAATVAAAVSVVTVFLPGLAGGPAASAAASSTGQVCVQFEPPSELQAVSASASRGTWAVGWDEPKTTHQGLILRWNGTAWTQQHSPGGYGQLFRVAAASAGSAWAVGNTQFDPLIEHWNGTTWAKQTVPDRKQGGLDGLAVVSASNAWTVGISTAAASPRPVIDHWNGSAWQAESSKLPSGAKGGALFGVAATSASSAWAAGYGFYGLKPTRPWIERWNGSSWTTEPSPGTGGGSALLDSVAASPASAWAVGNAYTTGDQQQNPLAEYWNGTSWSVVASPSGSADGGLLSDVTAVPGGGAWAVGASCASSGFFSTLIERWNGKSWTKVPSPNASGATESYLAGVSAVSASNAWAVGWSAASSAYQPLIEHWNGTAWSVVPLG
jgi:hypothetical protein